MSAQPNNTLFLARLNKLPAKLYHGLRTALARELEHIVSTAQRKYLSGPRPKVLGLFSGRLRGSVNAKVTQSPQEIKGAVGTNVAYARFHEFGFRGTQQVKAHTRATGMGFGGKQVSKAQLRRLRKEVRDDQKNFIGFRRSMKQIAGDLSAGQVNVSFVKAHERRINYAGRPFLRPAIRDEYRRVSTALREAIARLQSTV